MKSRLYLSAALLFAVPAAAQTVRSGVEAWHKGDHVAAVAVWTTLAANGDADAAFNLGQAHRLGKGVPINLSRAQQYFEQSARKGHPDAAASLGILLFQNNDRRAAMRWLRIAAEAGEARAMLLYGTALYNGDGIAPDRVTAYAYVSRSAAQGLDVAKTTLADLNRSMPLAQRRKGVALAKAMVVPAAPAPAPAPAPAFSPVATANVTPLVINIIPAVTKAVLTGSGGWRIQLGAFGQRTGAEALYARLSKKVGARQAFYVPAGKVVRLQVGPYDSRAAATAACGALSGHACFPVAAR